MKILSWFAKSNRRLFWTGTFLLFALWQALVMIFKPPAVLIPSPISVIASLPGLHFEHALVRELCYSFFLVMAGFVVATAVAVPTGFLLGVSRIVRGMTEEQIQAFRYLCLPLFTGMFTSFFGYGSGMKIAFLAVGRFLYLLPGVILVIKLLPYEYIQIGRSLCATKWQILKTIIIPGSASHIWDMSLINLPIGWTYISIVEQLNMSDGGIGVLSYTLGRNGLTMMVYAIGLIVLVIGILTDRSGVGLRNRIFKYRRFSKEVGDGQ